MYTQFLMISAVLPLLLSAAASFLVGLVQAVTQVQDTVLPFLVKITLMCCYYFLFWARIKEELAAIIVRGLHFQGMFPL